MASLDIIVESGVASAVLDTVAPKDSPTFSGNVFLPSTTTIGSVSSTEISYLDGLTGNIQSQINGISVTDPITGNIYLPVKSGTAGSIVFEGSDADDYELTLSPGAGPSSDVTVVIPATVSTTLVGIDNVQTLNNKTLNTASVTNYLDIKRPNGDVAFNLFADASTANLGSAGNATTISLFNTIATTVNAFGAATTLNIGSTTSSATITFGGGANGSGITKNINIGTNGTASSTTNVNIGSTNADASSTITLNGKITRTATSRNLSAWTTSGQAFDIPATTFTDTTSTTSSTIASRYVNSFQAPTLASSNAITVTDAANVFIAAPVAGTNTTFTNNWSLISDGATKFNDQAYFNNDILYTSSAITGKTNAFTLLSSDVLSGIITGTPTIASQAVTLPDPAVLDPLLLGGNAPIGTTFDWTLINLASATGTYTMTANGNHTYVGSTTISTATSARFRTRKTGTATFVTYRG